MILVTTREVHLTRNRTPIVVPKGESFDFSEAEAASIRKASPRALREPRVDPPRAYAAPEESSGYTADE